MNILAIDPGSEESAYCIINNDYIPLFHGKVPNSEIINLIEVTEYNLADEQLTVVIEMIASYGMAVGKEVFDTCVWIGRFTQASKCNVEYIYRKEEKMNLCGTMKAKDSNIRQALIDRFGVVGTKKAQGWFYGFKSDIWSAYAVGVTYMDKRKEK